MFKKEKNEDNQSLDDYVFINSKTHSIEKKLTYFNFFCTELGTYLLIALASYFAIYLGTNKFSNEKELEDNVDLLTKYFSMNNLENSLLGILIVIGMIASLNYIVTNSKISLTHFFHRLTHSFIDLIFLMISSMLGLFLAVLEYTTILELTKETLKLRSNLTKGIFGLIVALFLYTVILLMIKINSNKLIK